MTGAPNVATIVAHLVHREHATVPAAISAARELVALRRDRFFVRVWWLDALAPCVAASPGVTDRPDAVLDRLVARFAVRISDVFRPRCPRCRLPLQLVDVRVPRPTGYCRLCSRPPGHRPGVPSVPVPRTAADRCELLFDLNEVA
jgi:hypothetical protein